MTNEIEKIETLMHGRPLSKSRNLIVFGVGVGARVEAAVAVPAEDGLGLRARLLHLDRARVWTGSAQNVWGGWLFADDDCSTFFFSYVSRDTALLSAV